MSTSLLGRYAQVFSLAWRERKRLDGVVRAREEVAFLPAALALQETPVHPAPRIAMGLILAFAVIALVWAIFGRIDIVATAQGRLIPDSRSKVVQPMETAVVAAIHVRDGQTVRAGELLIELDATQTTADTTRIKEELESVTAEAARAEALLVAIQAGQLRGGASAGQSSAERRLLEGEWLAYSSRLAQIEAEIERRRAELQSSSETLSKLRETLPLIRARAEDFQRLQHDNFVSRHALLEKQQAAIEAGRDLAAQEAKSRELSAALLEGERQRAALVAETRRATLEKRREAQTRAGALAQEWAKAGNRGERMRLTAPVAGTVQQLAVHTVGGVVTPAQALLVVVPEDNPLEVEAFLENKDIGFVRAGQTVEVKVETFPFTKYGAIEGQVTQVSGDAIQDEQRGLIYAARIKLARTTLEVDGRTVHLTPGMAVTAEVKTGRRRVVEYFLSPLLQYGQESLRER